MTLISASRLRAMFGLFKMPTGWEPHLDFESASKLEATFCLLKVPIRYQPYLDFCECQQDINHIWTFVSASKISAIFELLKVGYCKD